MKDYLRTIISAFRGLVSFKDGLVELQEPGAGMPRITTPLHPGFATLAQSAPPFPIRCERGERFCQQFHPGRC